MIKVNNEKCKGCGLCVRICHESCMRLENDRVQIDTTYCSTCTQCVAVCPNRALSWNGAFPVRYERKNLPSPEQFDEMLLERRTVRLFKKKRIDRDIIEEIAGYGGYAPTNNYRLRAKVVDDEELIRKLERLVLGYVRWLYRILFKRKSAYWLLRKLKPTDDMVKVKPKVEETVKRGKAFHNPAAFVFVVGDRRVSLSRDSAQYALYNMVLAAQVRGIGSFIWADGPIFIDKSRRARKWLGIGRHEHILAAMGLGYPAVKFSNKVAGKRMGIEWNGGKTLQRTEGARRLDLPVMQPVEGDHGG